MKLPGMGRGVGENDLAEILGGLAARGLSDADRVALIRLECLKLAIGRGLMPEQGDGSELLKLVDRMTAIVFGQTIPATTPANPGTPS